MTIEEVFELAAEAKGFPTVQIAKPIKHFPNTKGRIIQIRQDGVSVDLGGTWYKWFCAENEGDKRSHYMSELSPCKP